MKPSLFSSLRRRLQWLNVPSAMLMALLQRTPAIRVLAAIEEVVIASPVSTILKSVATAAASLGAINSMAGATPLLPSDGTATGITVTTGVSVSVGYGVSGTMTEPLSWSVTGQIPPGLNFSGLTGSGGTVDVTNLLLSGTPTTPGSYSLGITVFEDPDGGGESVQYAYTITVNPGAMTAPAFTTQPTSRSVSIGTNVTFTVAASGNPVPTIQWQKNSVAIPGATSATLSLSNVQVGDAATYTAVATNANGTATSNGAVLTVTAVPMFTTQPLTQSVTVGDNVILTVAVSGSPTPTIQWKKGTADIPGATSTTLTLNNVQAGDAATYTAVATNSAGTATSTGAVLTVTPSMVPVVTAQPQGHTVATGSTVVFTATITGGGLSYQWSKDSVAIPGATSATLLVSNAQAGDAGSYTVTAINASGTVTSNAAVLSVVDSNDPGRLVNVSARIVSGTGNNVLIVGFVTGGAGTSGSKSLLIRGVGPQLALYDVPTPMVDPVLDVTLLGAASPVVSNDDWGGDAAVVNAENALGAFALVDPASKDSALVADLPAGVYTAEVSGKNNTSGTVLAEIYDANPSTYDPATPRLVNLSARAQTDNSNPLIAGFVISGSTAKTVLIRGVGPFLNQYFNNAMQDPELALYVSQAGVSSLLLTNDNWGGDPAMTAIFTTLGAFLLPDPASKDAVLLVTLDPGVYSAQVLGVNNASGIALVEIYEVP